MQLQKNLWPKVFVGLIINKYGFLLNGPLGSEMMKHTIQKSMMDIHTRISNRFWRQS